MNALRSFPSFGATYDGMTLEPEQALWIWMIMASRVVQI